MFFQQIQLFQRVIKIQIVAQVLDSFNILINQNYPQKSRKYISKVRITVATIMSDQECLYLVLNPFNAVSNLSNKTIVKRLVDGHLGGLRVRVKQYCLQGIHTADLCRHLVRLACTQGENTSRSNGSTLSSSLVITVSMSRWYCLLSYRLHIHFIFPISLNSIYFQISIYTWQHTSLQIHGKWIRKHTS